MPTRYESEILDKAKLEPYYSVRFQPGTATELTLSHAREIAQQSAVSLRGWDFPHVDLSAVSNAQAYIFSATDWGRHVELWRLYRSGQFVFLGAPWDLSMDSQPILRAEFDSQVFVASEAQRASVSGVLSFIGMIYSVTEFYLFAARLARALELSSFQLDVAMRNVENWALVSGDPGVLFHSFYRSAVPEIRSSITEGSRILADPVGASAEALFQILECFNWSNAAATIDNWQKRFMSGRFAL